MSTLAKSARLSGVRSRAFGKVSAKDTSVSGRPTIIEMHHGVELPFARLGAVAARGVMPGMMHPKLADLPLGERMHQRHGVAPGVFLFHIAEQQRHDAVEADGVEFLPGTAFDFCDQLPDRRLTFWSIQRREILN